ncbi:hypothetical protein JYU34_007306 [Plutella xylostella]|uniref:Uncharacterized protein n=1 Tax=Plutella xylostella TaxID=51655 RepID=A0ABQ7QQ24_PLUXY|nr:hypothetical protein JYU34_007306 [Plutella xylostella]
MKANGSRREEREEKISRKKSGASPGRCREKNSVAGRGGRRWWQRRRGRGAGGRCGGGRGRCACAACPRHAAATARHTPRARRPDPPRPECRRSAAAAGLAALSTHARDRLPTLHVQSVKVSASHSQRESAPAPDLQAGSHLFTAQGQYTGAPASSGFYLECILTNVGRSVARAGACRPGSAGRCSLH